MLHTLAEALNMYGPRFAVQKRMLLLVPAVKGSRGRTSANPQGEWSALASTPQPQYASYLRAPVQDTIADTTDAVSDSSEPLRARHLFVRRTVSEMARPTNYPLTFGLPARVAPRHVTSLIVDWQRCAVWGKVIEGVRAQRSS